MITYKNSSGVVKAIGNGNSAKHACSTSQLTPTGGPFYNATIAHKYGSATVFTGSVH